MDHLDCLVVYLDGDNPVKTMLDVLNDRSVPLPRSCVLFDSLLDQSDKERLNRIKSLYSCDSQRVFERLSGDIGTSLSAALTSAATVFKVEHKEHGVAHSHDDDQCGDCDRAQVGPLCADNLFRCASAVYNHPSRQVELLLYLTRHQLTSGATTQSPLAGCRAFFSFARFFKPSHHRVQFSLKTNIASFIGSGLRACLETVQSLTPGHPWHVPSATPGSVILSIWLPAIPAWRLYTEFRQGKRFFFADIEASKLVIEPVAESDLPPDPSDLRVLIRLVGFSADDLGEVAAVCTESLGYQLRSQDEDCFEVLCTDISAGQVPPDRISASASSSLAAARLLTPPTPPVQRGYTTLVPSGGSGLATPASPFLSQSSLFAAVLGQGGPRAPTGVSADVKSVSDALSLFTDSPGNVVSNAAVLAADVAAWLDQRLADLQEHDVLLVYYAGHGRKAVHGMQSRSQGLELQMSDNAWYKADDVLFAAASKAAKQHVVLIADACKSGTAMAGWDSQISAVDRHNYTAEVLVACTSDENSAGRHAGGYFTAALVRCIKALAASGTSFTLDDVLKQVREQDRDRFTQHDCQIPGVWKHGASLVFVPGAPAGARVAVRRVSSDPDAPVHHETLPKRLDVFAGRVSELAQLDEAVMRGDKAAVVTTGFGGIGKTSLVKEYCWRHRLRYSIILWVHAEQDTIDTSLIQIAATLGVETKYRSVAEVWHEVKMLLARRDSWLVVFDNAADEKSIERYMPAIHTNGRVIVTSRDASLRNAVRLGVMNEADAIDLLRKELGSVSVTDDEALMMVTRVGFLPLGIRVLSCGMRELELTAEEAVAGIDDVLVDNDDVTPADYAHTVKQVAVKAMTGAPLLAHDILRCCAYLAPEGIPKWLLRGICKDSTSMAFKTALRQLRKRGLLENEEDTGESIVLDGVAGTVKLHRLLQEVVRLESAPQVTSSLIGPTDVVEQVYLAMSGFHPDRPATWAIARMLHAHAMSLCRSGVVVDGKLAASLWSHLALYYQRVLGDSRNALHMHRAALALKEKVLGKEHPNYISSLNNLASCLESLGKLDEALAMHQEALALRKKVQGNEHPDYMAALDTVAICLQTMGKLDDALAMHQEALALREKVLGKEHLDYIRSLSNTATCLMSKGKLDEALAMHREALALMEEVLDKEHPDYMSSLNNVASCLESKGKLDEALAMHEEALALREKVLGKEHPDYMTSLNNVASCHWSMGKLDEALAMHQETLVLTEKVLGMEHPLYIWSLSNVARCHSSMGKLEEALAMYQEALALCEKVLGKEHTLYIWSLSNVASCLKEMGKLEEALAMHEEALALREKVLGKEHPDYMTSLGNVARCHWSMGNLDEALAMHQEALVLTEKVLGMEHPLYIWSLSNVASCLESKGKLDKALAMHQEALALTEKVLGKEHPGYIWSLSTVASCLQAMGKRDEALALTEKVLGKEHPDYMTSLNNVASCLQTMGQLDEAQRFKQQHMLSDNERN